MADNEQFIPPKKTRRPGGRDGVSAMVTTDRALRVRELMTPPKPLSTPTRTLAERAAGRAAGNAAKVLSISENQ
ncbi:MAG: hypothetical protein LBJ43_05860 [Propionibacteriaceae bacterium]|jgi:hypothetical protein|nr:hypothetical protein [Propionibacteriaceae bacterium]